MSTKMTSEIFKISNEISDTNERVVYLRNNETYSISNYH